MNNILVVNVNWLGDAIFSTPVFKALKMAHPKARVSCLAVPRVKEVLKHCAYIDDIIVFDEKGSSLVDKVRLIMDLKGKKFDAAFMLHRSATRAFMVFLSGIPRRIGFRSKKAPVFLTDVIDVPDDLHRLDEYAGILKSIGVAAEKIYELDAGSIDSTRIDDALRAQGITSHDYLVVVNAGGNWDLKRWPQERFAELIGRLVKDFRVKVVIPGAEKDIALAQSIAKLSGVDPIVLAGATGLSDLMVLFKKANCVISNDTGPLHLAASVGTNVIALFGPTRPEVTGPRGRGRAVVLYKDVGCNKAPCYHLSCSFNQCLHAISVDDVCQAFQTIRNS